MSDEVDKKYVSLTNYKALAVHLGKTKEEVVADKEAGRLSIMDLESVVRYVCEEKGWFFSKDTTAATRPAPPQNLTTWVEGDPNSPQTSLKDTVRWKVSDNEQKIDDPYLERTKVMKGR
jgi:hypothetical protein